MDSKSTPTTPVRNATGGVMVRESTIADALATSIDVEPAPDTGSGGALPRTATGTAPVRFDDVLARSRRLRRWAEDESTYVRNHDVRLFSGGDIVGRNGFADEGLYELLPQLLCDVALLRLYCGRGVLWDQVQAAGEEASRAVQDYYRLWQSLRDEVQRR